ncbi:MAG: molybdenum cofactor guanylyltransferase MobA [Lysobacterales bacterium]
MSTDKVCGGILAGGQGLRMGGQDKGLLVHRGRALFEQVLDRLAPQVNGVLISANRHHQRYAKAGWPVLADRVSAGSGPLVGIATLLAACRYPWLLTVPVDAPALPDDLRQRLCAAQRRLNAAVVVAHDGEHAQPLFALYRTALAERAALALAEGERAVWRFQQAEAAVIVDFSDQPQAFANINYPEDLDPGQ